MVFVVVSACFMGRAFPETLLVGMLLAAVWLGCSAIILRSISFKLILTPEAVYCWSWLTPLRTLKCSDIKKAESFSARGNTVLGLYPQRRNNGKITIPYSYFAKADREKIDAFVKALQLSTADGLTEKEEKQFNGFMVFYVMALYVIFLGLGSYAIYKEYFVHKP